LTHTVYYFSHFRAAGSAYCSKRAPDFCKNKNIFDGLNFRGQSLPPPRHCSSSSSSLRREAVSVHTTDGRSTFVGLLHSPSHPGPCSALSCHLRPWRPLSYRSDLLIDQCVRPPASQNNFQLETGRDDISAAHILVSRSGRTSGDFLAYSETFDTDVFRDGDLSSIHISAVASIPTNLKSKSGTTSPSFGWGSPPQFLHPWFGQSTRIVLV